MSGMHGGAGGGGGGGGRGGGGGGGGEGGGGARRAGRISGGDAKAQRAENAKVKKICSSWIWLTRAIPPMANPSIHKQCPGPNAQALLNR